MASMRVRLNRRSMAALLKGREAQAAIKGPTEKAAEAARSGAPVASGEYKANIKIEWDETDRAVGRVRADVKYAMAVEADTGNLARALDAAR